MEDFIKHEIRQVPRTELQRQKNYLELLPRPSKEEYQLLKESIERDGLHPGHPILVNDDDVVLDGYTRLQIAEELGLEWVWVQTLEFEDHYAEKLFIIGANLVRRHLLTGQRAAAALKFKEIEREKARERQRQAGELIGKNNLKKGPELPEVKDNPQLTLNSEEAGEEAMEVLARKFEVGRDTLYRAQKIEQAAQTDPEISESWDKVQKGEATVNQVYQQVQEKTGILQPPIQVGQMLNFPTPAGCGLHPATENCRRPVKHALEEMQKYVVVPGNRIVLALAPIEILDPFRQAARQQRHRLPRQTDFISQAPCQLQQQNLRSWP